MKKYGFTRHERLTRKAEFDRVCKQGRALRTPEMVIIALPNDEGHPRLGMVVGRRVGGAVTRNRIRRLLREGFRLNKHLLTAGHDIVVILRQGGSGLSLAAMEGHLRRFFEELRGSGRP